MNRSTKIVIGAVAAGAAIAATIGGVVIANTDDDGSDTPITGPALARASEVALDHLGGGRVTGTEVGDEDSYYEVEVTLDGGRQVDVQLDEDFHVVSSAADVEDGDPG